MDQVVQIVGALLCLTGFAAAQRGVWSPQSLPYLIVNFLGSGILTVVALLSWDLGFLLLESVWAIVSALGLIQLVRSRGETTAP